MLVITVDWLSHNSDGPDHRSFGGGMVLHKVDENGTADYGIVIVDEVGKPSQYAAINGDLGSEGWPTIVARALTKTPFTAVPEVSERFFAETVRRAQEAGCLDGPGSSDGSNVRHLRTVESPNTQGVTQDAQEARDRESSDRLE